MDRAIADLRQNYTLTGLAETDVSSHPIDQFQQWFEQALEADIIEPNAMTIATRHSRRHTNCQNCLAQRS